MNDYENPKWREAGRIHDWRNHISEEVRKLWHTFNSEQKKALYNQAEYLANSEEYE